MKRKNPRQGRPERARREQKAFLTKHAQNVVRASIPIYLGFFLGNALLVTEDIRISKPNRNKTYSFTPH
jgi:hypothetical protein